MRRDGKYFCASCDGPPYKGADEVIVIGGGNSALEEGLHLSEFAHRVRVLARSDPQTHQVGHQMLACNDPPSDPRRD